MKSDIDALEDIASVLREIAKSLKGIDFELTRMNDNKWGELPPHS